jgi:hypothetical protein
MTTETVEDNKAPVVTQDALLKSLQDIEKLAKGETIEEPAPPAPKVEASPEIKPAATTVEESASEDLKKGLNASPLLKEIVGTLGKHVDDTLSDLRKSLDNQAARDLAITGALESMVKSLGTISEKVETIGKTPAAPASARPVTAKPGEVLEKSETAPEAGSAEEDPIKRAAAAKRLVLGGLEKLVKSSTDAMDQKRFTTALIKFESTGEIDDVVLAEARTVMTPTAAASK